MVSQSKFKCTVLATSFLKSDFLKNKLVSTLPKNIEIFFSNNTSLINDEDKIIKMAKGADSLLVGREPISKHVLDNLRELKCVAKYGVGVDNLDLHSMKKNKVLLKWKEGINANSVAEHAVGLMISLLRNINFTSRELYLGRWFKNGGETLFNKKVGIIGLGNTGSKTAGLLQRGWNCKISTYDILDKSTFCKEQNIKWVDSLVELVSSVDIVSLHVPLTNITENFINKTLLSHIDPNSYFINVSRGEVVNQKDLASALSNGTLKGAASDVFWHEPKIDQNLIQLNNFIGTPHIAGNSKEAIEAMGLAAIDGLKEFYSC